MLSGGDGMQEQEEGGEGRGGGGGSLVSRGKRFSHLSKEGSEELEEN